MTPLTVVSWKWKPRPNYRSKFGPETVHTLAAMIRRHYPHPHRFICVTDDPSGLAPIETVPIWSDFANLDSPHGGKNPSCYRRLRMFHPQAGEIFGPRFVSMDLDCVIVNDLTPIFHRPEPIVLWGDTNPRTAYNGSMTLMSAGARPQVWERFNPQTSPTLAKAAGCWGSDQAWISYCLGPKEAKFGVKDGVYSFRNHLRTTKTLPPDARIVFFHGKFDPWHPSVQQEHAWVKTHWRA